MVTKEDLFAKNEWWSDSQCKIKEFDLPKRDLFSVLEENLSHTLMLNIVGLRRVGKSTLLKQMAAKLLNQKINPFNIFYFSFDYSIQIQKEEFLDEVLSVYFTEVLKKRKYSGDETLYILLDEIQYIDNWQAVLKRYYDLSGKQTKFIITGSQSVLLKGKHRESLAGRIFDFYLPPLSFREFLKINQEKIDVFGKFDLFELPEKFRDLISYEVHLSGGISELSREYITTGQFPETRKLPNIEKKQEYIAESVLGKVLEGCINVFNVEKSDEFKLIVKQMLNNAGSIFELANIGREVAISKITLDKYLEYLKESYVVEILYKNHKSLIKRGRILKKLYTPCANFICALNRFSSAHFDEVPQVFGKIIENVVYNVLKQKYGKFAGVIEPISFWRKGEKEIDFILNWNGRQLPIEVKFSNHINLKEFDAITGYIRENKLDYGVIVTIKELDRKEINGQTLYFIPYYLILFMI